MFKVTWLDVHTDLYEPPREFTRTFPTWSAAEKFAMSLQRKYPTPIEVTEVG